MPVYKSFKELKELARYEMEGNMGILIGTLLLETFITYFLNVFGGQLFPGRSFINIILNYVIVIVIELFIGILQVGSTLVLLRIACGMPCKISDLFYGFKHNTDKAIKIQFVFSLLSIICLLPANIITWTTLDTTSQYVYLTRYVLALLIGIVLYTFLAFHFIPILYLLLDFPNLSVKELFQKSFEIMKGNCLRYLLLELSFIPYIFLCIFTLCLGLLWLVPYMNMTFTNFYLDIMACNKHSTQV